MLYKIISIDLDDTLWPCMPTIEHAEKTSYQWLQQHVPQITQRYSQQELRDKRKQLIAEQPQLLNNLSAARLAHFAQLADELCLSHDWIEKAFNVFLTARQKVSLYDDVLPVLGQLTQSWTLVALTNGNADIHRTGLGDYFDQQISAADVNAAKPDPAMFLRMINHYGVSPEQCLHVGDHPEHDIQGARNAGVGSVWLNRQQQPWPRQDFKADYEITDLKQLLSLLTAST